MGIITKLSWRSLRTERSRTLMTIGAMTIAATLMVASLVGLRSLQTTLYDLELSNTGGMVANFPASPASTVKRLAAEPAFAKTLRYQVDGKTIVGGKTHTKITASLPTTSLAIGDCKQLKPLLYSGRLPRKADEVLLSAELISKKRQVGQRISITVAGRTAQYRIVGTVSPYSRTYFPTTGVLRLVPKLTGNQSLAVLTKSPVNVRHRLGALAAANGLNSKQVDYNSMALSVMGEANQSRSVRTILAVLVIILAIIGAVSLTLIYTSINLSVKAHRQHYGLLRSLGTTPKQLRHLVYWQGVALAVPALVLGGVLGIGGLSLTFHFLNGMMHSSELPLSLVLTVDWLPLVIAAVFLILITLLAAARPAFRASRVTPIAAIRALEPKPKLAKRKLKSTWLMKHIKQPLLLLAAKFSRRQAGRTTMLVTLTITVMLFVGLTGFVGNIWRNYAAPENADIIAEITGKGDQTQAAKRLLHQTEGIKSSLAVQTANLVINGSGPNAGKAVKLAVVSNHVAQADFAGHPTLLNTKIQVGTGNKAQERWLIKAKSGQTLTFLSGQASAHQAGQPIRVVVKPLADQARFKLFETYGYPLLVLSATDYQRWQKKLAVAPGDLSTTLMAKLARPSAHTALVQAIKARFGKVQITDIVADNQQAVAVTTAVKVGAYGFITLIALVSLATVINHTFANLLEQRRGLAMLQSIGTTPKQLVLMQTVQYGQLFFQGWLLGSGLGLGLAWLLYRVMASGAVGIQLIWPLPQITVVALALTVITLVFGAVTWRMLAQQDIDQLIRAE
ncbi:FtsX-like permease family protein [Lacticaseibacillus jixianensis]|uniref:FtsX-like permease family protein n=1 Tax=Lacticaseibacillus jixianensis TaxID=2486012 RepID=A0ABW4B6I2_9LACO|nr:ABC transporter permease [Lacticaseibacillus jixianensis]